MDHHQLDLFRMVPDKKTWKLMRPWVTAATDMRTPKRLAWSIVDTPNSASIATVLKRVFLDYGRPRNFYWDNGQDFECDWLDGVLSSLEVRVTYSIVKRACSKMIEPTFQAMAAFERTTPWWVGHKPDARPERMEQLTAQRAKLRAPLPWFGGKSRATHLSWERFGQVPN